MSLNLLEQLMSEESYERNDTDVAMQILLDYINDGNGHKLPSPHHANLLESLLYNYFLIKGTPEEEILNNLLKKYNFDYTESIHNALYYLLGRKSELGNRSISPYKWPGITNITKIGSECKLDTILGDVTVYKASRVFSKSPSAHIFRRELNQRCYIRSYDFIKENKDYKVVLSKRPNFFLGTHYHTYLEKNDDTLDIACNAFYDSKESVEKVLKGEILAKLSYEEIEEQIREEKIKNKYLEDHESLYVLCLKHDKKKKTL